MPRSLLASIRAQARKETRIIDEVVDGFDRELVGVLRTVERRISQLVAELETRNGKLVFTRAELGRAVRLRTEILAILEEAGYADLVASSLDTSLDRLTPVVLDGRRLSGRAAALTNIDVEVIEFQQTAQALDLLGLGDDLGRALWRTTVNGVIASRRVPDLVTEMAGLTGTTQRQARSLFDTAVSTFTRTIDQLGIVPRPSDRFVYVGPNDAKTRPWCRDQLAKGVQTRAQITELDNGQIPNSLLTAGGWNCRHKWFFLADQAP